jgi:hypothetical protein
MVVMQLTRLLKDMSNTLLYTKIFLDYYSVLKDRSFYDNDLKHDNSYNLDGKILFGQLKFIRGVLLG